MLSMENKSRICKRKARDYIILYKLWFYNIIVLWIYQYKFLFYPYHRKNWDFSHSISSDGNKHILNETIAPIQLVYIIFMMVSLKTSNYSKLVPYSWEYHKNDSQNWLFHTNSISHQYLHHFISPDTLFLKTTPFRWAYPRTKCSTQQSAH